jgi:endo-1,4-beta-xylanase
VVSHYKGKVAEWAVVEEPYAYPFRQNDYLYQMLGYSYIDIAFRAAREADPSAELIYGDAGNQSANGSDINGLSTQLTRQTVQRLKAEGLIDAVAVEMHLDASDVPTNQDIVSTLRSYGLPVIISSFDVSLEHVSGTEQQRLALQAKIAANVVKDCLRSLVCKDFSLWGIDDRYSMYALLGQSRSEATPFTAGLQPKPEYFAIRSALTSAL